MTCENKSREWQGETWMTLMAWRKVAKQRQSTQSFLFMIKQLLSKFV